MELELLDNQIKEFDFKLELEEQIAGGDWLDEGWEDSGYKDEFDRYANHNNEEAEDAVMEDFFYRNKQDEDIYIDDVIGKLCIYDYVKENSGIF